MKLNKKIMRTGMALSLGLLLTPLAANAGCQGRCVKSQCPAGLSTVISTLPYEELSAEETAGLVKMREEEKLARDVYQVLAEKWQSAVFSNISRSEQRHMDSVKYLLDKYEITDPVIDSTVGMFTDPELQELFEQLTAKGNESLVDALQVGAAIEDLDIYDLQEFISQADNEDIITVYQNLLKGSRNHLRAFWYQLSLNGGDYESRYISAEEFSDIVTSDKERGQVDVDGNLIETGNPGGRGNKGKGSGDCQMLSLNDRLLNGQFFLAGHRRGQGNGSAGHNYGQQQQRGKGGHGPGNGTGNGGNGPKDGTGNGPGTGDCPYNTKIS